MSSVEYFLEQGLLPFVGRKEEIERLLTFWKGTIESQRLRVFLLTAEAGAGKSRLLEEFVSLIEQSEGLVIHVKLYPDGANNLIALIAQSLKRKSDEQQLSGIRSGESLNDVTAALRRLSRLRPVLLILEDLHLLPEETLPDLGSLLGQLADETLSILACARPVKLQARSLLERALIESLTMKGIEPNSIVDLWRTLFTEEPKKWVATILYEATFGNGLALRSAFRALLQRGGIEQRSSSDLWRMTLSKPEFELLVRQSVSLVVEGLVAQLSSEMRRDASRIAMLGEVFARESAEHILGSAECVNALQATGLILAASHLPSPIAGYIPETSFFSLSHTYPTSRSPLLVFTHSLLHSYLVAEANPEEVALYELLANNSPLYSYVPFRLLRSIPVPDGIEGSTLGNAIRRSLVEAQRLDQNSNWREGHKVWETAEHFFLHLRQKVSAEVFRHYSIVLKTISLALWRREMGSERWLSRLDEVMVETEGYDTDWSAHARILVCSHWCSHFGRANYQNSFLAEEMVESVLERFPKYRLDTPYVYFVEIVTLLAVRVDDGARVLQIQDLFNTMLADPELPSHVRSSAIRRLPRFFLQEISSEEEIEKKDDLIALIEEEIDEMNPYFGTSKGIFQLNVGRFKASLDLGERVMQVSRDWGAWSNVITCGLICAISEAALGRSISVVQQRLVELTDDVVKHGTFPLAKRMSLNAFLHVAVFLGVEDLGAVVTEPFGVTLDDLHSHRQGLIGLWAGQNDLIQKFPEEQPSGDLYIPNNSLILWITCINEGDEQSWNALSLLLQEPVLQLRDILAIQGSVRLWNHFHDLETAENDKEFIAVATGALCRGLNWLYRRGAYAFMSPLIDLLQKLGQNQEVEDWRAKSQGENVDQGATVEEFVDDTNALIQVSMLGTIRVAVSAEGFAPLRGVRIRTLLGLMVADQLITRPLSSQEFLRLAGGDDPDPEHARKKKNMGVVRLREIMGREAILTDQETPRLNTELVKVDLLEANKFIQEATLATSEGVLVRALPLIEKSLNITAGEVAFPTLYDNFFEAVRGDFEHRLRKSVLDIAQGLIDEGDQPRAEGLLRKAFMLLPGEEEIGEMLQNILVISGNRVEAERIRMSMGLPS